jgi:DNA-binding response OmpR family regulator
VAKIFVLDDSPSVCFAVESILEPKGYDVVVERSGTGALARLEAEAPDLVLCDLVLPDAEGFDICQFIRRNAALSTTPIVVISGVVDDEVKGRASKFGIRHVLKKPFGAKDLLTAVENAMAEKVQSSGSIEPERESATIEPPMAESVDSQALSFLAHLDSRIEVRFSLLMDPEGKVLHSLGSPYFEGGGALAKSLAAMARQASEVTVQAGFNTVRDLTLEWEGGALVMHPMADGQILVLSPEEKVGLGKARYLVRRAAQEYAGQAL